MSDGTAGGTPAGDGPPVRPALQVVAGQAGPEELAAVTAVVAAVLAARQQHAEAAGRGRASTRRDQAGWLARPGRAAACPADARPRRLAPRRAPPLTRQPPADPARPPHRSRGRQAPPAAPGGPNYMAAAFSHIPSHCMAVTFM